MHIPLKMEQELYCLRYFTSLSLNISDHSKDIWCIRANWSFC